LPWTAKSSIESAPDFFTIDSSDDVTGAAPMPLLDDIGLTIRESLPLVVDILNEYGSSDRVKVTSLGKFVPINELYPDVAAVG
jgi:glutamate synthase domain-containing protein 2